MKQQSYRAIEVAKMYGFSVSTLKREGKGGWFPKSVRISKGRKGWLAVDLEKHSESLKKSGLSENAEHLPFDKTWRAL